MSYSNTKGEKIEVEQFLEYVAEVFEVESEKLSMETDFRAEIEDFCSLMGFSMICMMEDEYGVRVTPEQFIQCRTLGELYALCAGK